jgi:hypothetical protein
MSVILLEVKVRVTARRRSQEASNLLAWFAA